MSALRIGSLCTGYGGLDLAVSAALAARGIETSTAWVADPDPGATKILAHHWLAAPNLGDITRADWGAVPPVDILAAGFPCQDVSAAGTRAGIAPGTRSGLWAHVAHAIHSLRPRLVVLENVRGLLSAPADRGVGPDGTPLEAAFPGALRAAGAVLGDLAARGLDAEWISVRASDVGAPHRRERVFLLAWPADAPGPRLEDGRAGRPGGSAPADAPHLGHERGGEPRGGRAGPADRDHPATDADGGGLPGHPHPDREPAGPETDHDDHGQHPAGRVLDWGTYAGAIHRWEHALGRPAPAPTEPGRNGQPRLAPAFVEWLMGLPDGWVTAVPGLSRTQQLRALGNGVVPQQGAHAVGLLLNRAPVPAP